MSSDKKNNDDFFTVQARHVRQCLKEASVAILIWLGGFLYCTFFIISHGYILPNERPEVPELIWGMPAWVFQGLFLPWFVTILATWLFAAFCLKDEEPYMDFPENHGSDEASK